ncbi:unnamed protein product [Nippostrongylus brasiliensis]|uniref:ORF2 n=1 Tax=Nippostrongylus brasiliensis TaxID=27835 RepID=A0A0N4YND4_NIPBR|nr:unnamed protein product [Nippostrongylus brasiliensis]
MSPKAVDHRSKHQRRSRSRSPLPDDLDVFTSLSSLATDHETLASAAVSFVGWRGVEKMLPPCLQGRSREDVIQLVSDELDGMSKKRISHILNGENVPSSSSSSDESDEDDGSVGSPDHPESHAGDAEKSASSSETGQQASDIDTDDSSESSSDDEVRDSESEEQTYSDVELIEGLDADSSILPDVN